MDDPRVEAGSDPPVQLLLVQKLIEELAAAGGIRQDRPVRKGRGKRGLMMVYDIDLLCIFRQDMKVPKPLGARAV